MLKKKLWDLAPWTIIIICNLGALFKFSTLWQSDKVFWGHDWEWLKHQVDIFSRVQDAVVVKLDFIRLAQHVSHTNLTQDVRRTMEGVLFMLIVSTMVKWTEFCYLISSIDLSMVTLLCWSLGDGITCSCRAGFAGDGFTCEGPIIEVQMQGVLSLLSLVHLKY